MAHRPDVSRLDDTPDISATSSWTRNSRGKRVFDVGFAMLMILLFLPVFVTILVAIVLTDRGPAIYAHTRIGKGGRKFQCYKFRTMVLDADTRLDALLALNPHLQAEWEGTRKLKEDPRILPYIGSALRRSSLDELPQILNVLKGDMSIVGPRPIVEDELKYYGVAQHLYLQVRPGLTGPWQATERSDSSYSKRVKLDATYVQSGSFATDLQVIWTTARKFVTLSGRGAY
ncbi:sugar transferase [Salipiger sp. PrR002]|uniref:sugar transferase n=1 Tax=Salipiger sp. PrR002 TaxID=2706489 RepID=UPI0013BB74B6|nr:sugar transferase [Salipiger sp. PrR002]NDW01734.1 sugar transferase [Salipiger sp. PrR002]NDW57829.1 sugar transferase [Salipiger sp. PrR004]